MITIKTFVCCLLAILWSLNVVAGEDSPQNDGLYKTIQQEKQMMMMTQVDRGMMKLQKSCRNSCGKSLPKRMVDDCHCDKQCVAFGDCCVDYWQSCNASFSKAYNQARVFECLRANLHLSNATRSQARTNLGYTVVTKCPTHFQNLRVKNACENPERENEKVLPFVQGKNGMTYMNQHCAECHEILEYQRWDTRLSCSNETLVVVQERLKEKQLVFTSEERRLIRDTCVVQMRPPFGLKTSRCRMVKECTNRESPDYLKCRVYKEQIYSMVPVQTYKNPHCARCSGALLIMLSAFNSIAGGKGDPSLGLLFDFTKNSKIFGLKEVQVEQECKPGEIYDRQLKTCRKKRIFKDSTVLKNWTCAFANETFPNSTAYITVHKNLSIYVPSHEKMYKPSEYLWHDGNVTVCGNLSARFLRTSMQNLPKLYSRAEYLITVIGLTLSILALLVVIITYCLFPELRSKLPGKIVINLSVALMLAQLVFLCDMFEDVTGDACTAIAVLLQFLLLAAFCWMNVMAFDVSRTFAGKSHRSPSGSRNKVFLLSLIYAWGLPLLITGLTLIINHTGAMNVAYGNNYYCWITNPVALVIFFVVPVVLMLLFNIIALVRVLVAVRRVRKVTKKVREKSTAGQDARMCWKLTAVFGLTWILCLAAEHHIALRVIYIIFNSLQGVFIMVSFIMTKRVLNMYLKKAGKEPLSTSAGTTNKSTLSKSELTRKSSSAPLVERKSVEKRRDKPEQAVGVARDEESPEDGLISSMEGPETKL